MSNLEGMISAIESNAKHEADEIISKAKVEAEEIKKSAINEANDEKNIMIKKAEDEAKKIRERTLASAELKTRDDILRAKQQIMDEIFVETKKTLKNLSDEEFYSYLENKIKGLELKGNEKIILPKKYDKPDLWKLPVEFEGSDRVSSGFLVEGESSVLNFSFDDLLDFSRDDLEKEVMDILFEA